MFVKVYASELLAATKLASTDKHRIALGCVYVKRDGVRYAIAATDSYKLVEFTNDDANKLGDSVDGEILIDASFIKSNIKAADKYVIINTDESGEIKLDISTKKGVVRTKITKAVESNYPKYEQLLDEENVATSNKVIFDADFMKDVCDCASKAYGKGANVQMEVKSDIKPIEFASHGNNDGKMRAILMPKRSM